MLTVTAHVSLDDDAASDKARYVNIRADTVGELRTAEFCVSYMPSLKAKKLEKLTQEKAVLER